MNTQTNTNKHAWLLSKKWIIGSVVLVILALAGVFIQGLKLDIDFAGGTRAEVVASCNTSIQDTQAALGEQVLVTLLPPFVESTGGCHFQVETTASQAGFEQEIIKALNTETTQARLVSFEQVGPSLGAQLKSKALLSLVLVALAIIAYVAYAFTPATDEEALKVKEASPIKPWLFGVVAVIALIHDIVIPAGLYAWLGMPINTQFVIGVLAILGLSVNDTIVVFDRIRENIQTHVSQLKNKTISFKDVALMSVKQTLWRSLHTSLTLVVVLGALLLLGPDSTKPLATMLLAGTIVGTYSSIFFATPLLVLIVSRKKK